MQNRTHRKKRLLLMCRSVSYSVLIGMVLLLASELVNADSRVQTDGKRIQKLIKQLGSDEFAARQRARDELELIGAGAFDLLYAAKDSGDIEIRLQARYLLQAIPIEWLNSDDPDQVKKILSDYRKQDFRRRQDIAKQLASLPDGLGVAALCRIVRFESSDDLSKRAAFSIIEAKIPNDASLREKRKSIVRESVGYSHRVGANWLRTYVRHVDDQSSTLAEWDQFGQTEEQLLQRRPSANQKSLVRDFVRWQIELLDQLEKNDLALALMRRTISVQITDHADLVENLQWLIKRKAWTVVDQITDDFKHLVQDNALLTYLTAQSFKARNDLEAAKTLAKKAFEINSTDDDDEALMRLLLAGELINLSMLEWAEDELRHIAASTEMKSDESFRARQILGHIKHDWGKHKEAADVYETLVLQFDTDKEFGNVYQQYEPVFKGLYHFSLGLHFREIGDVEKEKEHLSKSFAFYPPNIDSLIEMHRVKTDDAKWIEATRSKIETLRKRYEADVRYSESRYERRPTAENQEDLAVEYNQYAWLVSNTFGDYELALARSKKSNDLRPDYAGHLDTLGRCYYAVGDLQNAIFVQRRAAELEPYTGQIIRQLDFFEKAATEPSSSEPSSTESKAAKSPVPAEK